MKSMMSADHTDMDRRRVTRRTSAKTGAWRDRERAGDPAEARHAAADVPRN
jgi:hypothetical protein